MILRLTIVLSRFHDPIIVTGPRSGFFDINELRPDRAKRMEKLLGKFGEHEDAYLKHCA